MKNLTGSGLIPRYITNDGNYFIIGKRFCGKLKGTFGGDIEESENPIDTAEREYEEEMLLCAPVKNLTYDNAFNVNQEGKYITHLYHSRKYSKKDLEQLVKDLNTRAHVSCAFRNNLLETLAKTDSFNKDLYAKYLMYFGKATPSDEAELFKQEIVNENLIESVSRFTEYTSFLLVTEQDLINMYLDKKMIKFETDSVLEVLIYN